MRGAGRPRGLLARAAFALTVLVSVAVLFAPSSDVPAAPPGVDKLVHAGLFAVLAVTGRWAGIGPRALAALLAGYAVVSELVQGLSALGRTGSVADALADLAGTLVGLLVWAAADRRRVGR